MKNKMKLWRREAQQHNSDASEKEFESSGLRVKIKHQGRKNKTSYNMNRAMGASVLLQALFEKAGFNDVSKLTKAFTSQA
jgi:hypothetical protein